MKARIALLTFAVLASLTQALAQLPDAPQPKSKQPNYLIANGFNVASTFVFASSQSYSPKGCIAQLNRAVALKLAAHWHPTQEFIHGAEVGLAADGVVYLVSRLHPGFKDRLQWISGSIKLAAAGATFYDNCAGSHSIF